MSNELMTFTKIDYKVAMFMVGREEWIQLKTVVESLGLSAQHTSDVAERLPDDYKKLVDMAIFDSPKNGESVGNLGHNNLRKQQWFVSKAGAYRVVLTSNSPKAEPFLRWLEMEVIPSIIDKGYYIDKKAIAESPEKRDALYDDVRGLRGNDRNATVELFDFFKDCIDYDREDRETQLFIAGVQNYVLFAATEKTAPEIVKDRCDHNKERCGMVQDIRVNKSNLCVSKNYLSKLEFMLTLDVINTYIDHLVSFRRRGITKTMTMKDMRELLPELLRVGQFKQLEGHGTVSRQYANRHVERELKKFKEQQIA